MGVDHSAGPSVSRLRKFMVTAGSPPYLLINDVIPTICTSAPQVLQYPLRRHQARQPIHSAAGWSAWERLNRSYSSRSYIIVEAKRAFSLRLLVRMPTLSGCRTPPCSVMHLEAACRRLCRKGAGDARHAWSCSGVDIVYGESPGKEEQPCPGSAFPDKRPLSLLLYEVEKSSSKGWKSCARGQIDGQPACSRCLSL